MIRPNITDAILFIPQQLIFDYLRPHNYTVDYAEYKADSPCINQHIS